MDVIARPALEEHVAIIVREHWRGVPGVVGEPARRRRPVDRPQPDPGRRAAHVREPPAILGYSAELTAAWVRFPELSVEPLFQRYTRLEERTYLYESLRQGRDVFHARLEVDAAGLVERLRDDIVPSVVGNEVDVKVGGLTASADDFAAYTAERIPIFMGAVLLLSFLFSMSAGSTTSRLVLVLAFALLVVVTVFVIMQTGRSMRLGDVVLRLQDTTAEIRVRFTVLLLIGHGRRFGIT